MLLYLDRYGWVSRRLITCQILLGKRPTSIEVVMRETVQDLRLVVRSR